MINPHTPSYHLLLFNPEYSSRDFAFTPQDCVGASVKWICKQDGETQVLRENPCLGNLRETQDWLASTVSQVFEEGAGYATLYSPHVSRVYEQLLYWYLLRHPDASLPGVKTVDLVQWFYKPTVLTMEERLGFSNRKVFEVTGKPLTNLWKECV